MSPFKWEGVNPKQGACGYRRLSDLTSVAPVFLEPPAAPSATQKTEQSGDVHRQLPAQAVFWKDGSWA